MNWNGRKVLVTGAGGFIGSHLTERLVELGADVRAMVHYNALGRRGWLDYSALSAQCEIVQGDVCDRDSAVSAARGREVIFHLAALIAIPYSYTAPAQYVRTNIEGTMNVLQAARNENCKLLIHTSTSEVYGTALYAPIDEKHPLQGQSPYSATKIGADKMVEAFHRSFSVPVITVRPFNTFGPRQSTRAVIPTIITQCLSGEQVKLGALNPTRDLNFVADTVGGFIKAAETPGAAGDTINIGSGREISVGELAKLISGMFGRELHLATDDQRMRPKASEVERLLADNTRAREKLGWSPQFTLEQGLERTIEWYRQNLHLYRVGEYAV